eukprot:365590-Chlamydomonas_euryale.AAC.3
MGKRQVECWISKGEGWGHFKWVPDEQRGGVEAGRCMLYTAGVHRGMRGKMRALSTHFSAWQMMSLKS